jgi:hypothetical protein
MEGERVCEREGRKEKEEEGRSARKREEGVREDRREKKVRKEAIASMISDKST